MKTILLTLLSTCLLSTAYAENSSSNNDFCDNNVEQTNTKLQEKSKNHHITLSKELTKHFLFFSYQQKTDVLETNIIGDGTNSKSTDVSYIFSNTKTKERDKEEDNIVTKIAKDVNLITICKHNNKDYLVWEKDEILSIMTFTENNKTIQLPKIKRSLNQISLNGDFDLVVEKNNDVTYRIKYSVTN